MYLKWLGDPLECKFLFPFEKLHYVTLRELQGLTAMLPQSLFHRCSCTKHQIMLQIMGFETGKQNLAQFVIWKTLFWNAERKSLLLLSKRRSFSFSRPGSFFKILLLLNHPHSNTFSLPLEIKLHRAYNTLQFNSEMLNSASQFSRLGGTRPV